MEHTIIILREFQKHPHLTQRELSAILEVSLGSVNRLIATAIENGYLKHEGNRYQLSESGRSLLEQYRVHSGVIMAAGFGSRFVPLTFDTPKGLLKVHGVPMIERQISQLHEVGIRDITIVVGYLKEHFEYLIDKFGVKLLYNPEYATKNTIATLYHARHLFEGKNVYLLSSDNWMRHNMYQSYEAKAWYSASFMDGETKEWCLTYDKKGRITDVQIGGKSCYVMYGPVYFSKEFSKEFFPQLETAYHRPGTENDYWEQVFMDSLHGAHPITLYINKQPSDQVYEFENLEELRIFDDSYRHTSDNLAMQLISEVFDVKESDITQLRCLKAGMTNKSFIFKNAAIPEDVHFICRIPGKGTEHLINREQEFHSYTAIQSLGLSEEIVYMNPKTGYKIAKYYAHSKNADFSDPIQLRLCMNRLRYLHHAKVSVSHTFDIAERIHFFENLCEDAMPFQDYDSVRQRMERLLSLVNRFPRKKSLCHIDPVCDNFLIVGTDTNQDVKLIDWEYSGMADPLIDIAMCAIYSCFNKYESDALLSLYLQREPSEVERFLYYSYMSLGGFLWTLWAIYKTNLGESYGDYTLKMYRYAKDFHQFAMRVFDHLEDVKPLS